jgi:DNA gyrase/topoisomerase IV subunit A
MITKKTISEFLSNEYKDFAMYTIENRAIASVIDSFKTSQRKIIYISNQIWKTGNEKPLKVFQLSGKVSSDTFYHHSGTSMENAIITMAQRFKNNIPFLEEDGQFGSLRSPQAGAPRYIGTKLSDNFRKIYKDFDLLEYRDEEGEKIEPYYFLPIIPTILLNGTTGIAVGFASTIMGRNINDIIDSCILFLKNKKVTNINPYIERFNGSINADPDNHKRWIIRGKYQKINNTTINITELPPSLTYEKYEEILDKLAEDKIIISYEDKCRDSINYIVKMSKASLESLLDKDIIKLFKLEEQVTENYSTLDENGNLKIFENSSEIIEYFVNFRLKFYKKRKDNQISHLENNIKILSNKYKFIRLILDKIISINNIEKKVIIQSLKDNNLEIIDNSYEYLLRMPISSLTKENSEALAKEIENANKNIDEIKKTDPKEMYIKDLNELKKSFKK